MWISLKICAFHLICQLVVFFLLRLIEIMLENDGLWVGLLFTVSCTINETVTTENAVFSAFYRN